MLAYSIWTDHDFVPGKEWTWQIGFHTTGLSWKWHGKPEKYYIVGMSEYERAFCFSKGESMYWESGKWLAKVKKEIPMWLMIMVMQSASACVVKTKEASSKGVWPLTYKVKVYRSSRRMDPRFAVLLSFLRPLSLFPAALEYQHTEQI